MNKYELLINMDLGMEFRLDNKSKNIILIKALSQVTIQCESVTHKDN